MILVLTPLAPSLGWLVAAIVAFSLLFNLAADPTWRYRRPRPATPARHAQYLATLVQFVGQVGVTLAVAQLGERGIPPAAFALVAVVLVLSFAVTVIGVREPAPREAPAESLNWREYVASLLACQQAMRSSAGSAPSSLRAALVPFLTLYAVNEIGATEGEALRLFVVLVAVTEPGGAVRTARGSRRAGAPPGSARRAAARRAGALVSPAADVWDHLPGGRRAVGHGRYFAAPSPRSRYWPAWATRRSRLSLVADADAVIPRDRTVSFAVQRDPCSPSPCPRP